MKQSLCRIRSNTPVADGYNQLEFEWPSSFPVPEPGQFVTVRTGPTTDPLLRRPFAVSGFAPGICRIVYQIRGKGTQGLAASRPADQIDVLGPLGNGFPDPRPDRTPFLLGGGIGFGPIYYFATNLAEKGCKPVAIIGARTASLIPDLPYPVLDDGEDLFQFCTDDGTSGFTGNVIDFLKNLRWESPDPAELFACGPNVMLAACAAFCEAEDLPCWVSMEQIMGCGVGACMGCAVRARGSGEYLRVCTDGPVFSGMDLKW